MNEFYSLFFLLGTRITKMKNKNEPEMINGLSEATPVVVVLLAIVVFVVLLARIP